MTCCDIYTTKKYIKSEIKFSSNLPTPARWENDVVNQQTQEYNMKNKLELFVVKPNDDREKTFKNFIAYLERQGIKVKRGKHEK